MSKQDTSWLQVLRQPEVTRPSWNVAGPREIRPALASARTAPTSPDPLQSERSELAERTREVESLRVRYLEALSALTSAKKTIDAETVSDLTELAFSVGRELAMRDLQNDPTPIAELIRKMATGSEQNGRFTVRVAAEDFAALMSSDALSEQDTRGVEIVADTTLAPGACVMNGKKTQLDASFQQRERAVRRELSLVEEPDASRILRAMPAVEGRMQ